MELIEDINRAYHEAGHAVAGYLLNRHAIKISIDGENSYCLFVQPSYTEKIWPLDTVTEIELHDFIMIYFAGFAVNMLCVGEEEDFMAGAYDDFKNMNEFIAMVTNRPIQEIERATEESIEFNFSFDPEGKIRKNLKKIMGLLEKPANLAAVKALATLLLEKRTIQKSSEIKKIISNAIKSYKALKK